MWNIRKPLARRNAQGLTLVEMLMATALTLIMFAAVAQIFGMMGGAMQDARATIELSGNLRSVANHLQNDLDNLTVEVKPWVQPGSNQGYFEIIEGPDRDVDFASVDVIPDSTELNGALGGDADDIICFTAYSKDEPFVGLIQGELKIADGDRDGDGTQDYSIPHKYWIDTTSSNFTTITSQYAEIVYFTKFTGSDDRNLYEWSNVNDTVANLRDVNETVTLYRRVFLIRPDIFVGDPGVSTTLSHNLTHAEVRNYYDLSLTYDVVNSTSSRPSWKANSLEDLQLRQHRMAHRVASAGTFPYAFRPHAVQSFEQLNSTITGNLRDRTGEDVILTRVLAFDVKVFDPGAQVKQEGSSPSLAIAPGDRDYDNTFSTVFTDTTMTGAFVDLNWGARDTANSGAFFGSGCSDRSQLGGLSPGDIYGVDNFADLVASVPQIPSRMITDAMYQSSATSVPEVEDLNYAFYDTWPFAYEMDGENQDRPGTQPASIADTATGVIDEGTNGFDDNGNGVVDELAEYETSPPYPVPLRGISITVRAIEEGSRQVRQDTIMADFLPK